MGWGSARLEHFLSHLKLDAAYRLAVCNRKERGEGRMADDRRERVAVLVRHPVVFRQVRMPGPGIPGMQMLKLRVCGIPQL